MLTVISGIVVSSLFLVRHNRVCPDHIACIKQDADARDKPGHDGLNE